MARAPRTIKQKTKQKDTRKKTRRTTFGHQKGLTQRESRQGAFGNRGGRYLEQIALWCSRPALGACLKEKKRLVPGLT